jgi:hypothetical protein
MEVRGKLDEILGLARHLKVDGFLADADGKVWTKNPPFAGSAVWFQEILFQRLDGATKAGGDPNPEWHGEEPSE